MFPSLAKNWSKGKRMNMQNLRTVMGKRATRESLMETGEPYEVPSAAIQQPVRTLPKLFPDPPLQHPDPLDEVHNHPLLPNVPSHTTWTVSRTFLSGSDVERLGQRRYPTPRPTALRSNKCYPCCLLSQYSRRRPPRTWRHPRPRRAFNHALAGSCWTSPHAPQWQQDQRCPGTTIPDPHHTANAKHGVHPQSRYQSDYPSP